MAEIVPASFWNIFTGKTTSYKSPSGGFRGPTCDGKHGTWEHFARPDEQVRTRNKIVNQLTANHL